MSENKDGGFVYPRIIKENPDRASQSGREPQEFSYPGITRRNKLIDDLVVSLVQGDFLFSKETTPEDHIINKYIPLAIRIADATIAESNK